MRHLRIGDPSPFARQGPGNLLVTAAEPSLMPVTGPLKFGNIGRKSRTCRVSQVNPIRGRQSQMKNSRWQTKKTRAEI